MLHKDYLEYLHCTHWDILWKVVSGFCSFTHPIPLSRTKLSAFEAPDTFDRAPWFFRKREIYISPGVGIYLNGCMFKQICRLYHFQEGPQGEEGRIW